jgi:hypothetical protein
MLSGSGVPQAGAQSVGEDSVVGSAEGCEEPFPCDFRSFDVTVDVRSGPDGENATGSLNLGHGSGFGTYSVDAQASCLAVSGNVAVVGFAGTYRQLTPAFEVPVVGFLWVSDGATGSVRTRSSGRSSRASRPAPRPARHPRQAAFRPSTAPA